MAAWAPRLIAGALGLVLATLILLFKGKRTAAARVCAGLGALGSAALLAHTALQFPGAPAAARLTLAAQFLLGALLLGRFAAQALQFGRRWHWPLAPAAFAQLALAGYDLLAHGKNLHTSGQLPLRLALWALLAAQCAVLLAAAVKKPDLEDRKQGNANKACRKRSP